MSQKQQEEDANKNLTVPTTMETKVQEQHCNKDNKEDTNNDENDCPKTSSNNNTNTVVFTDLLGIVNHGYLLTWCKSIFSYLGPTAKDTVSLRSYCKLFSKALKPLPC